MFRGVVFACAFAAAAALVQRDLLDDADYDMGADNDQDLVAFRARFMARDSLEARGRTVMADVDMDHYAEEIKKPLEEDSWSAARAKAENMVKLMDIKERATLLSGGHVGFDGQPDPGYYAGNVDPVPEMFVPALKMQDGVMEDGSSGFRNYLKGGEGTATAWPSMLALAATWDEETVRAAGVAIGEEFSAKGANVMLGPSVNVHRSAYGGHNQDSLAGEDPVLGARLGASFVQGVQSQKVMAAVSHFALDDQDSLRDHKDASFVLDAQVDERTLNQLYYPPFKAAVDAGAGAIMCAYSRINGEPACGSQGLLTRDLKKRMGFQGYVMSAWGAARHHSDVGMGLDQEMPGYVHHKKGLHRRGQKFALKSLQEESSGNVQEAATRVLTSILKLGLDQGESCQPPKECGAYLAMDATSEDHQELAKDFAAKSVVLLANMPGALPIKHKYVRRIGVAGEHAYMNFSSPMSPAQAILDEAKKQRIGVTFLTGNPDKDEFLLKKVDRVVFVGGAEVTANRTDRKSLALAGKQDSFIRYYARKKPTIVTLVTTGAVLTPWRNETGVVAVANLFLAGQAASEAMASVLFGSSQPGGKLPIMFPKDEADAVKPCEDTVCSFSEGLRTSYRGHTEAAYPFGHGLAYTTFSVGKPEVLPEAGKISVKVTNTGRSEPGTEVVQVYARYPERRGEPGEPLKELKYFQKTKSLEPAESQTLTFDVAPSDFVSYRAASEQDGTSEGTWEPQRKVLLEFGTSSADIKHRISLNF